MMERLPDSHIDPARFEILEVWRSINENLVGAEGYPSQLGLATVVAARSNGRIGLYVHYWLIEDRVGLLYREQATITPQNYAHLRDEAVAQLEAMGFIVDNAQYRAIGEAGRERLKQTLPVFGGGPAAQASAEPEADDELELVDADDDVLEEVEAVSVFVAPEPESILLLDEDAPPTAVGSKAGQGAFPQLGQDSWKVFFRMIASL